MELNRKAILFTFLSVMIAALLSAMYSTYQITPLDENIELEKIKVTATNKYLINVISYADNSLKIASYIALQEMIEYIHEDDFFSDEEEVNKTFKELVMNGTINDVERENMKNLTINVLMDRIKNVSQDKLNINMSFNISDVWIDQRLPFTLSAYMNFSLIVNNQDLFWNITNATSTRVVIEGLKDPIYFNIGYNSTFKETKILPRKFNSTTFEMFVNNSEYIASPHKINISGVGYFKPLSFFGRLTNDPSVKNISTLTILSIVSPEKLVAKGIPLSEHNNESYVDFMFDIEFYYISCDSILKRVVNNTNQAFVDKHHLQLDFNLTGPQVNKTYTC
ncbi:MAG: hypothetical protein H8D38_05455 [DPANN group archaeon]|nr:hypothetical protein [DPANN group archaeon]